MTSPHSTQGARVRRAAPDQVLLALPEGGPQIAASGVQARLLLAEGGGHRGRTAGRRSAARNPEEGSGAALVSSRASICVDSVSGEPGPMHRPLTGMF